VINAKPENGEIRDKEECKADEGERKRMKRLNTRKE
jgi:hypothetical protein